MQYCLCQEGTASAGEECGEDLIQRCTDGLWLS